MALDNGKLRQLYTTLQKGGYKEDYNTFVNGFSGNNNYSNRKKVYDLLTAHGAQIGSSYEEFMSLMQQPKQQPKQQQQARPAARQNPGHTAQSMPWGEGLGALSKEEGNKKVVENAVDKWNFSRMVSQAKPKPQPKPQPQRSYVSQLTPTMNTIYDILKDAGEKVGSVQQFQSYFERGYGHRKAIYDKLVKLGAFDGSYNEFAEVVGLKPKNALTNKMSFKRNANNYQINKEVREEATLNAVKDNDYISAGNAMLDSTPTQADEIDSDELQNSVYNTLNDVLLSEQRTDLRQKGVGFTNSNIDNGRAQLKQDGFDPVINSQIKYLGKVYDRLNNKYLPVYQTTDGKQYHEALTADKAQRYIDVTSMPYRETELRRRKQELEDAINKRGSEIDRATPTGYALGGVAAMGLGSAATPNNAGFSRLKDTDYLTLQANLKEVDEALGEIEEAKRGLASDKWIANSNGDFERFGKRLFGYFGGSYRGFMHSIGKVSTWDFGLSDIEAAMGVARAVRKADKVGFENLSKEQQKLLNDAAQHMMISQEYAHLIGRGYKAGQVTAESLPFMLEMIVNPASSMGKAAQQKVVRSLIKKFGKDAIRKSAQKYLLKKYGARVVGDALGASVMASTTGSGRVYADTRRRMTGDLNYNVNESGEAYYYGHEKGESFVKAFAKAFGAQAIENHSEMLGEYIKPLLGVVGKTAYKGLTKATAKNLYTRFGVNKVRGMINDVMSTPFAKFVSDLESRAKWNGMLGEYAEEVIGNVENALLVGDNTLDADENTGVFDLDQNIDTFLGVSLMGGFVSSVKTGYYLLRGKKRLTLNEMNKAGRAIDSAFSGNIQLMNTWGGWRNTILLGTDEEKKSVLREILDNKSIPMNVRMRILDYAKSAQEYQGIVKAQQIRRYSSDEASVLSERIDNSADEGYEATNEQKNAIRRAYRRAKKNFDSVFGEQAKELLALDENELFMLTDEMTTKKANAIYDYLDSKSRYEGMLYAVQDKVNDAVDDSNKSIDERTHTDGTLIKATMNVDDRQVYIVNGNIVLRDDGSIDMDNSDKSIVIVDAETNKREMVAPSAFKSVDTPVSAEEVKAKAAQEVTEQITREESDIIDGKLDFNVGDTYDVVDQNENQFSVQIIEDKGDNVVVQINGQQTEMAKADVQKMYDDYVQLQDEAEDNKDGNAEAQEESQTANELKEGSRVSINGVEYTIAEISDNNVTLVDSNGKRIPWSKSALDAKLKSGDAEVLKPMADVKVGDVYMDNDGDSFTITRIEDNNVYVADSKGVEYEEPYEISVFTDMINAGMLTRKENEHASEAEDNASSEDEDNASSEGMSPASDEEQNNESDTPISPTEDATPDTSEPQNESMPMKTVGKGKNARQQEDWLSTTPKRGYDYLFNEVGLKREEAKGVLDAYLAEAQKKLDAERKKEVKFIANVQAYKEKKIAHEQRITELQAEVDYWKSVKDEYMKVLLEEKRERDAKDAADHDQAVEDELKRKEDEARKKAEAEARGSNAVSAEIRDKWNEANKIVGAEDEVTLPNGETITGHYILVESGAATPSHQSTNGFEETEGFPVDQDGKNVNDRDYKRDKEAQQITLRMGENYDQRAIQSPIVVSQDGVVLSGNGRTMAGEIAAQNGTDIKYNDYLRKYGNKYGFTQEQIAAYQHPRVVFVPDVAMPYNSETFAKFNQREQKSQNRTETAVKMGKLVSDDLFGRVMSKVNEFSTLGEFYANDKATTEVIKELAAAGVIPQTEMAGLFDGGKLSEVGQGIVEGVMIGKAFQANPDAVRQITEIKSMRQAVMTALQDVAINNRLGNGYDLSNELAAAIDLVYKARKAGFQLGQHVSQYAHQGNLFQLDDGATVADFNNAAVMMLADVLNDKRVTILKQVISSYNAQAENSSQGIGDLLSGGAIRSKEEIINEINQLYNNGQEYNRTAETASDRQGRGSQGSEQGTVDSESNSAGKTRELANEFNALATELNTAEGEERMRVLGEMRDYIAHFAEENGYPVPEFLLTREDFLAAVPEKDRTKVEQWLDDGWHCPAYYEKGKVYYFVEGCDNFDKDVSETLSHEYTHADNAEYPENVNALMYAVEDTHEVSRDELIDILETLSNSSHYEEKAERLESEGKNSNPMLADEVIAHAVSLMVVNGEQTLDSITKNPTLQFIIKRAYKVRENERRHNILASETSERSSNTSKSSETNSRNSQSVAEGESRLGRYGRSARSEVETREQSSNGRSTVTVGEEVSAPSSEGAKDGVTEGEKSSGMGDVVPSGKGDTPLSEKIATASAEVNTEPTEAQKEAGNYKKGHVQVGTFDITIEQPQGSVRKGTDADGKQWESKMNNTYGYIRGAVGVDGDHIDVFLSNDIDGWNGRKVFVVDQYNPDGSFDEHKVMLGFNDADEAKSDYLANYEKGWEDGRRIDVSAVNLEDFEKWIASSKRKTKPFGEYSSVKKDVVERNEVLEYEKALDHLEDVEQKWEDKIQDYVSEHYPTQATTSAESTSEKGLQERKAMKADPVLKQMYAEAKKEIDAADEMVTQKYSALPENLRQQKAVGKSAQPPTREETILRDVVIEHMKGSGLDVIGTEDGQRVLDMANEADVRFGAKQKRALETATIAEQSTNNATVVSSADGAKVQKILETLADNYEKRSNKTRGFITDLSRSLGLVQHEASQYGTFETRNGKLVTIRVSNHNARVSFFDENGEEDGISIVISSHKNKGVLNDGKAHLVEYFYPKQSLERSGGKPLADIVKCVSTVLESGKFEDTTGLAQRQEVNAQQIREHRVYHGSGADFDAFDHSHMGEGEGSQSFGWGTYVTNSETIGKSYANRAKADFGLKRNELESDISRAKEQLPFVRGEVKEELETKIRDWETKLENFDNGTSLYTVEIPEDNGKNYLDWRNSLPDGFNKEAVKERIMQENRTDDEFENEMLERDLSDSIDYATTGMELYKAISLYIGDKAASKMLYDMGFVGIKYPAGSIHGGVKEGDTNYVIFNEKDAQITDHVRFFRTANGEAYGFTVGGKIYIDPKVATSETPVHEYAHLWATALKTCNPNEWQNVVSLMKGTSVWNEVKKLYPELKSDDEIADEVLATYSGRRGAERLREEIKKAAAEKGNIYDKAAAVNTLQRVKQAIDRFWKAVADFLHIHYESAEQVADQVMKDLLNGVDPRSMMDGGRSLRSDTEINIVEGAKEHGFKNYAEAKTWAKEHIARTYSGEETGGKGDIRISNAAVDKYLSQSAVDKSDSKDVHLSVLKVLPDVIRESVDAEQHADFKKGEDGVRSAENGINPNVTIHRLYGAVRIDGKVYRVKVTLKENTRTKETPKAYSYEATKIELLEGSFSQTEGSHNLEPSNSKSEVSAGQHGNVSGLTSTFPRYSDKSITAAKLLNGVEKSYGGGKFFEDYNRIREQFIGEQGAERADHAEEVSTRLDNLSVAREMEAEKKDAKAIKMATGWERGADGKWRYEIADMKEFDRNGNLLYRKHHPDYARYIELQDKDLNNLFEDGEELTDKEREEYEVLSKKFESDKFGGEKLDNNHTLEAYVDAPELFKAYPELKDVGFRFEDTGGNEIASYRYISSVFEVDKDDVGEIVVNTGKVSKNTRTREVKSAVLHEIQHAIQEIEGFARGGNPKSMQERFEAAKKEWRARAWADALRDKADEMGEHYNQVAVEKALIDEYKEMGMDNEEWMPDKETRMKGFNYFARGYADRSMDADIKNFRLNESTRADFSPYVEYTRLGGEVESRNVEARMGMSAEERRASLAAETEDVSREDQLFLFGNNEGGSYSLKDGSAHSGRGKNVGEASDAEGFTAFANQYGVDAEVVKDYASGMKTGNLQKAEMALAEIRRTMRVANRGMKLSEFGKLFRPVQKELTERYGDIEKLRQEYIDAVMRERGVMEAARKRAEEEEAKRKARADELSLLSTEELDKRYFDAIENGDDATAREMLDEAARCKGYDDTESDYQGVGAWSAPSNPGYESDAERRADVEDNAPDVNIEDIALGYSLVDEKYWQEPRKYMQTDATAIESVNAIREAIAAVRRGEKNVKVKVYRAVPTSVKEGKLRNGDWVTPSKDYAKMHGEHRLGGDYRIIEDEVPVNELWWDGNDSREWGFDDGKGYKYKNVENNRKLNDLVTRDDNGEIIPPSKRFDENVEDVRYREAEPKTLKGEEALTALENIFNEPTSESLPSPLSTLENFRKVFSRHIRTFLGELVKVKDEVFNKIIRERRANISGAILSTIENADFAIRDTDGSTLYVKRYKSDNSGNTYNVVAVNKHGEVEDYVSSVHIKRDGNLRNKIKNGAELLLPQERNTDGILSRNNSTPAAKVVKDFGSSQLSPSEKSKHQVATDLARQMHIEGVVDVLESSEGLSGRKARAKGWFDPITGRITIVLSKNENAADVARTIFHEAAAHLGLRELVGKEHYDTFLDNIYNNAEKRIQDEIKKKADEKYKGDLRRATDEYMAELAEDGEFVKQEHKSFLQQIKDSLISMLRKVGIKLGFELNDNDLRYILWRSWKNLAEGNARNIYQMAEDARMQDRLLQTPESQKRHEQDILLREANESIKNIVEDTKKKLEQLNEDKNSKRKDAVELIGGQLSKLHEAMRVQREYDMHTVASITELAQAMLKIGMLKDLSNNEANRILSVVKNVHGKRDISQYVQNVFDIMIDNQLKNSNAQLTQLLMFKGKKKDARGVEVQGKLDVEGQRIADVVWRGLGMSDEALNNLMSDLTERMNSSSDVIAKNAKIDYAACELLKQYNETIRDSKSEEKELRASLAAAKEDLDAGNMDHNAYLQYRDEVHASIRENKMERIEAYQAIVNRLGGMYGESMERAKQWRETEIERVKEIHHNANSDMEGRPCYQHYKPTAVSKAANSSLLYALTAPLGTFEEMLRMFGNKNVRGEGYLWNRYMRGFVDARNNEVEGYWGAMQELDDKVAEVFGKGKKWSDLFSIERKLPKGEVRIKDGNEVIVHELPQGNLLYIYMVNKMSDGRMKLRKMDITEATIEDIESMVDPKLKKIADWLQDEFLVKRREKYNKVHERMFGASMAAIDNYFPLKILKNAIAQNTEIENKGNDNDRASTITGSIKKRTRNSLALDIMNADAFSVVIDHIKEMEHWAAFAEWNRDLNTLLSYKRFRNQVINMSSVYGAGNELLSHFEKVCQIAAGVYKPSDKKFDKVALNIAKGVTGAKVTGRVFTAFKQLTSYPAYLSDANPLYLANNLLNPAATYEAWKWSMENLPMLRERFQGRFAGDPLLMSNKDDWSMWRSKVAEFATKYGMAPNAFVDALTISMGTHAVYKTKRAKYLRMGYSEEQADKRAKQDATISYNMTQQSSEGAFMSMIQSDRTWITAVVTAFRNSSISYTRMTYNALRNTLRRFKPGYRGMSEEFMAKQMEREGIDPNKASEYAKREYRLSVIRDFVTVGVFAYILPFVWNLTAYTPYLLFGDDDDKKKDMWSDIFTHTMFGSVEGLALGDMYSATLNSLYRSMFHGEDFNANNFTKDLPFVSDINTMVKDFQTKEWGVGLTDVINIMIQSGIGINPQTLTDAVVAIYDYCGADEKTPIECALLIMRIMNCPQSQMDKIYFDELDMTGAEAKQLKPAEIAKRYAEYKAMREAPIRILIPDDGSAKARNFSNAEKRAKEDVNAKLQTEETKQLLNEYKETAKKLDEIGKLKDEDEDAYIKQMQNIKKSDEYKRYKIVGKFKAKSNKFIKIMLNSENPEERKAAFKQLQEFRDSLIKSVNEIQ